MKRVHRWIAVSILATGVLAASLAVKSSPRACAATGQVDVQVQSNKQGEKRVQVAAPGTGVYVDEEGGEATVDVLAPGVRVQRTKDGVRVIAPFVNLFVPSQDKAQDKQKDKAQGEQEEGKERKGHQPERLRRVVAERRAYLGVVLEPVPEILVAQFPDLLSEGGALIQTVVSDSPAAKAGLVQYDIILKFGDKRVKSPEDVVQEVLQAKPGTKVKLTVLRKGKTIEVEVTLGERLEPIRPYGPWAVPRGRLRVLPGRPLPPQPRFVVPPARPQPLEPSIRRRFFQLSISRHDDARVSVKAAWSEDGQRKELTLEGTVDEVRKQLRERKDVPKDVKRLILQNLTGGRRRGFRIVPFFGFDTDEGFFGGPMILFDEGDGDFRLWIDSMFPDPEEILRQLPPDTPPEIRQEIERALRRFAPPKREEKKDRQPTDEKEKPAPQPLQKPTDRIL